MGAQRAAWQAAFRAETAAAGNGEYGQVLFDLVKAFEKIPPPAPRRGGCAAWV